jgi:hypothetical protein
MANSEPHLISRIVEKVLGYKNLQYSKAFLSGGEIQGIDWKEYFEFSLPILASVLPAAEIPFETQIDFFKALSHIGTAKFAFDSRQPSPNGLSIPIITSLIQCLTEFGHRIDPSLFISLIQAPDEHNSPYFETFFDWMRYIEQTSVHSQQRCALLNEIVCNFCPLWLFCVQINPPIFHEFQFQGLSDFLRIPFYWFDHNDIFKKSRLFVITEEHFEGLLDLIVTILQKIASGAIIENPPHQFQRFIADELKQYLESARGIRARILTAFAAMAVHSEELMKQRIIFEFECLPGMIDLIDQSPVESAGLLVRALVILIDEALTLNQNSKVQEILEGLDLDQIEINLEERALPDFEKLRQLVDRIHGE